MIRVAALVVSLVLGGAIPLAAQASKPKILLYYDMEGISGINREVQTGFANPEYQEARKFLTGDVNAAIRGIAAGGAGTIVVTDAHGSGNPDPDILLDQMDKRATFEWRSTPFDNYRDTPDKSFAAIVCIGMHARANTPGFLAHTWTIHPAFRVNGLDISETEIIAHSAARFGVPVIMVSGDDVLQKQVAERLPHAEYGLVKRAKGIMDADLLTQAQAQANIESAAHRAMAKLGSIKPFQVAPEYRFEMGWQNEAQADLAMLYPGLMRVNPTTVGYTRKGFIDGYDVAVALIRITGAEQARLLQQILSERPEGKAVMAEFEKRVLARWADPAAFKVAARPKPTRYHGAN